VQLRLDRIEDDLLDKARDAVRDFQDDPTDVRLIETRDALDYLSENRDLGDPSPGLADLVTQVEGRLAATQKGSAPTYHEKHKVRDQEQEQQIRRMMDTLNSSD